MQDIYIIDAVRSPIGKRGKGLAGLIPADLLGAVQLAALQRSGIDASEIGQVVGGCVSQVGEQSFNIARWRGCRRDCRWKLQPPPSIPSAVRANRRLPWGLR